MLTQLALFFLLNRGKQNARIFYAEKVAKKITQKVVNKKLRNCKVYPRYPSLKSVD
jgi:hypothetical protein